MLSLSQYWGIRLPKNKAIEIQISIDKHVADWFKLCLETRSKQDHAGLYFTIELAKVFYFHAWFYDVRHWNWQADRFYYENESEID